MAKLVYTPHFTRIKQGRHMIKETVILKEYPNSPKGYAQMYPPTHREEWDKIFEVCNDNNAQYLRHTISQGWVEDPNAKPYRPDFNDAPTIPVGIIQYRITIYMQDKS